MSIYNFFAEKNILLHIMTRITSHLLTALIAILLVACTARERHGVRLSDRDQIPEDEEVETLSQGTLHTDSIQVAEMGEQGSCELYMDWPKDGPQALMTSLREWIGIVLFADSASNLPSDPRTLAERYCREQLAAMQRSLEQMSIGDYNDGEAPEKGTEIRLVYETPRLVTYEVTGFQYFTGGGHGSYGTRGATFRKSDGKRYGNDIITRKDDTLRKLLKEGLKTYFKTEDESALQLIVQVPLDMVPLPDLPPYLLKDGLHFQYGVYDICPFDYGAPGFTLPIEQVRPYLDEDLLDEIE